MRQQCILLGHGLEFLEVFKSFWRGVGWGGLKNKGSLMRRRGVDVRGAGNEDGVREDVVKDGVEHLDCLIQVK